MPRIDDRALTGPHEGLAVAADSGRVDGLLPGEYDALRWYDVRGTGVAAQTWHAGVLSVGEPVFAPVPRGGERGYWLTFATDRTDDTSWLLILSAEDPAQGSVARVRIPVPLGLHGTWLPTEE